MYVSKVLINLKMKEGTKESTEFFLKILCFLYCYLPDLCGSIQKLTLKKTLFEIFLVKRIR
jgi:hypothetical protein